MWPLLSAASVAAPVQTDDLPVVVEATAPWRASVRGAGALTIAREAPPAEFSLRRVPGVELDFARLSLDEARADLEAELASVGAHLTWGPVAVERRDHRALGPLFVLSTDGRVAGGEDPVRMRFATWSGPGGRLVLGGGIYADVDRADALFAEALDLVAWREPPVADPGPAPDGYTLDLPPGWRFARPSERQRLGLAAHHALAFDPGTRRAGGIGCVTNLDRVEVIPPDRVAGPAAHLRERARALLAGGGPGVREVRRAVDGADALQTSPVTVEPDAGTLDVVHLGDRDAWLWQVPGDVGGAQAQVALLTVSAGERVVDCVYAGPEVPPAVLDALRSVRITSGEPPYRTWTGVYVERWPFRHPLLQVWWLGAALLVVGAGVAARALR